MLVRPAVQRGLAACARQVLIEISLAGCAEEVTRRPTTIVYTPVSRGLQFFSSTSLQQHIALRLAAVVLHLLADQRLVLVLSFTRVVLHACIERERNHGRAFVNMRFVVHRAGLGRDRCGRTQHAARSAEDENRT